MYKIGNGFDVHRFEKGKRLVLGGVFIEFDYGLKAHSDGDVLLHSIIDAILGATGLGDIGILFPDTNEEYKNIASTELLKNVLLKIKKKFEIINIDNIIICEKPKISPYRKKIQQNVAKLCGLDEEDVGIKSKTMENIGEIGQGKGIAVMSVCLVEKIVKVK